MTTKRPRNLAVAVVAAVVPRSAALDEQGPAGSEVLKKAGVKEENTIFL